MDADRFAGLYAALTALKLEVDGVDGTYDAHVVAPEDLVESHGLIVPSCFKVVLGLEGRQPEAPSLEGSQALFKQLFGIKRKKAAADDEETEEKPQKPLKGQATVQSDDDDSSESSEESEAESDGSESDAATGSDDD